MIKINSPLPNKLEFICNTQDEIDFCESHKDEIIDNFIWCKTGKFKTLEEYLRWYYNDTDFWDFGEMAIIAKWNQTREWGLVWHISTVKELEDMFNKEYNKSKVKE